MKTEIKEILHDLSLVARDDFRLSMMNFGIEAKNALGVRIPDLRKIVKKHKNNHRLAMELFMEEVHELKLLAIFMEDPKKVDEDQMELWVKNFYSWDICDQACSLFSKTTYAYEKAKLWALRENEFEKRAGFVLMACMAVHAKKNSDTIFLDFIPLIKKASNDKRNFVKKALNWSIRQIGKRSIFLNRTMINLCEEMLNSSNNVERWIYSNALWELKSNSVQRRLLEKNQKTLE